MTPKERFYATINNQVVDRPATWLGLPTPGAIPALLEYFQLDSVDDIKKKLGDDVWPVIVPYHNHPFNDIGCALDFTKDGEGGAQDERTLTAPGYFEHMTDPAEVEKYPWPDPRDFLDIKESLRLVKTIPEEYLRMGIMWSAHFQDSCAAFGMEDALLTMMLAPEMYQAVIDRITDFYLETNELFYEATKGYLDAVLIGNDFGGQQSLMVDPGMLREFVFPGTKKLIDQAKSYGLTVVHHSCGSIFPIIGDLFDLGVDVIHPIQALAADMDVETLKNNFGNKGAFCGGVDAQELLVHGTPDMVTEEVSKILKIFPSGLVISPSHEAILPDIDPRNVEAIYKALK